MSFIRGNQSIEMWLNLHGLEYSVLKNSGYTALLKKWRSTFEGYLERSEFVYQGDKAMSAMEGLLPSDVFIFNFPGYDFLPSSTNIKDKVYAYEVKCIESIDKEIANKNDSIICDFNFGSTCLYTHEWQSLGTPKYFES